MVLQFPKTALISTTHLYDLILYIISNVLTNRKSSFIAKDIAANVACLSLTFYTTRFAKN